MTRYDRDELGAMVPMQDGDWVKADDVQAECRKLGYESVEELGDAYMYTFNKLAGTQAVLQSIIALIEKAGVDNLANGVQLGATSWYVKMQDALQAAKHALSQGEEQGRDGMV